MIQAIDHLSAQEIVLDKTLEYTEKELHDHHECFSKL